MAQTFFQKALQLDPGNAEATRGLKESKAARQTSLRVAFQDPHRPSRRPRRTPPPAPAPRPRACRRPRTRPGGTASRSAGTPSVPAPAAASARSASATAGPAPRSRRASEEDNVARQQLTSDVEQRLQAARSQVAAGQPEAALNNLRLAQNVVRSATNVPESVRRTLDRRIQAQMLEHGPRRGADRRASGPSSSGSPRPPSSGPAPSPQFMTNQETIKAMMIQFDLLMGEGVYNVLYNGGMGNISAATAPVLRGPPPRPAGPVAHAQGHAALQRQGSRSLRRHVRLHRPWASSPRRCSSSSSREYRYMLTMQDVTRAAVPFPDDQIIEYPDAERWRNLSERRIARYGKAVDLFDRDPKTKQILEKLDEPISMSFPNETPLEDVLKYIKQATQGAERLGHPDLRRPARPPGGRQDDDLAGLASTSKAFPSRRPSGSCSSSSA